MMKVKLFITSMTNSFWSGIHMNNEVSPNEIRDKRMVGEISLNCCIIP